MFKDRSGMFEDFGFKLVVINSILEENTSFAEDLKKMKEKYLTYKALRGLKSYQI